MDSRIRQDFNSVSEEFTVKSHLDARKKVLCSKIEKSHLSNCTICLNPIKRHKMRVQYTKCKLKTCPNKDKPCFRILKCFDFSKFSISTSRLHESSNQTSDDSSLVQNLPSNSSTDPTNGWFVVPSSSNATVDTNISNQLPSNNQNANINDWVVDTNNIAPTSPSLSELFNTLNAASDHVHVDNANLSNFNNEQPCSRMSVSDSVFDRVNDILIGKKIGTVWKTGKSIRKGSGRTLIYKTLNDETTWLEYEIDQKEVTHRYRQISSKDDKLCIFDIDRNFFLMLTNEFAYCGKFPVRSNMFDIVTDNGQYYVFNHGTWIELCVWKKQYEDIDETLNETVLFKKIDNVIWHKLVNGVLVKELEFVQTEKNEVLLFDTSEIREKSFLKLNSHEALNGPSKDECTIIVCKGDWLID